MGFLLDPLAALMILVVTGVGLPIHIYSIGYMGHDVGYSRYFAYLSSPRQVPDAGPGEQPAPDVRGLGASGSAPTADRLLA